MNMAQSWQTARAIMLYMSNRSFAEFFDAMFPESRESSYYRQAWRERWVEGFAHVFAHLDYYNQHRFLALVDEAYGAEVAKDYEVGERCFGTRPLP